MRNPVRWWREQRALIDGEAERMIADLGAVPAILAAHKSFADTSRPASERRLYHHVTLRIAQKADIPLSWA